MAPLLALVTSALYGTGDFLGGVATRRSPVLGVLMVVQGVGLVGLLIVIIPFGDAIGAAFALRDVTIGLVGGLAGVAGLGLLYRGLATGPMGVVAPLTAVTSVVVPVGWDLLGGTRPGPMTVVGMIGATVAVVLISSEPSTDDAPPVGVRVIGEALAAGCGFGVFFILFSATDPGSAPWPVIGARFGGLCALLCAAAVVRALDRGPTRPRGGWGTMVAGGLCDTGANVTFLLALSHGTLSVVAVLSSLYPAATVLLARLVLSERFTRQRLTGLVVAGIAVVLISAGS